MSNQDQTAQGSAAPASVTGKSFADMNGSEKITFIGKMIVMLITGGFAFPNIFVEYTKADWNCQVFGLAGTFARIATLAGFARLTRGDQRAFWSRRMGPNSCCMG